MTGIDWMLDMEIALVRAFHWPIHVIEQTDVESLMLFVHRLTAGKSGSRKKKMFIDQVSGLL